MVESRRNNRSPATSRGFSVTILFSTYLQYYVLSKQYLTALTYYYDFNVYIKYVEKNMCMNYGHALGQWKGF